MHTGESVSPKTKKKLKRLKMLYRQEIAYAIAEIKEDPFIGKPLGDELTGRFTYRISVYRIIYTVNQKDKIIIILNPEHRSTVYN